MVQKPDVEIAQEMTPKMAFIEKIAEKAGIKREELELYGNYKAKISLSILDRLKDKPDGKLIWTTAITATPAGEGKTVTSIGLAQGFGQLKKNIVLALREPSLGPTFGIKGGATGGGYSQVYPMWDIDLHFTGDIHAVGVAHNLLSAMVENHITKKNELGIDPTRIVWRKVMDMNSRELRKIIVGLGGRTNGGIPHESGFDITVASEISAILALSSNMKELKERLSKIVVAYTFDGKPVTAGQLKCIGAMALLLKDAMKPNLVQTFEGQPAIIHGFPFANIAHGNNSILATRIALKLGDYVVTEAGFAADLGMEKAFDIVCRLSGLKPDCVVLVASIRALKMHGGLSKDKISAPNREALEKGFVNLDKHIENMLKFGVPVVVAINKFPTDTDDEMKQVKAHCDTMKVRAAFSTVFMDGGKGGVELAEAVMKTIEEEPSRFKVLYDEKLPIKEKVKIIATEIYGAKDVQYVGTAENDIKAIETAKMDKLPICMAKTQLSITDDPTLKGVPKGWTMTVREVRLAAGAGFIVPLTGEMMTIPGLPTSPAAEKIDIDDSGHITGLN
jgi:formate--tetrahydrofolate ligase